MNAFATHRFSVTPAQFARLHLSEAVGRLWWLLLGPVGAVIAFVTTDRWAYLFLGLILLMIVYPLVLAFVYFNYALTPDARLLVTPHTVSYDPQKGLTITIYPADADGQPLPPQTRHYAPEQIADIIDAGHTVIFKISHATAVPVPSGAIITKNNS